MTKSVDLRWRCIVLYTYAGYNREEVAHIMGVHPVTIERWLTLFNKTGIIEVAFALVKKWILKNAYLAFHECPNACLELAFLNVCGDRKKTMAVNLFGHCGYLPGELTIESENDLPEEDY